jgi:DNA-binding MarR family transcriptional regulator
MTVDQASDVDTRAARAFSRALFSGAQYRIEVGVAIAQDQLVSTADLADRLGLSRQSVNQELHLLERVGLIRRVAKTGSERKVFFVQEKSDYWAFCESAFRDAADLMRRGQSF